MSKRGHLSDPATQGRLRAAKKDRDTLIKAAFRDVLNTPSGRMVMSYIINDLYGIKSVCLDAFDQHSRNLWEGRRWAAALLNEALQNADLDLWVAMEGESLQRLKILQEGEKMAANAAETDDDDDDSGDSST